MYRHSLLSLATVVALAFAGAAVAADRTDAGRAGVKVRIDPATGNVVDEAPATAEARAAENGAASVRPAKADYNRMTTRQNARGATLLNLNGQVRMYAIARVSPQGDVDEQCVTTDGAAEHAHGAATEGNR